MATSERQKNYVKKYQEKMDAITIRPPAGTKERWRAAAEKEGKSLTQFIMDCVEKRYGK